MSNWVCTWGVPTTYPAEQAGNVIYERTVRYSFFNNLKGNKIRFGFSNEYGRHDAVISACSLAESSGKIGGVIGETFKEVTFSQNGNVIKAGKQLVSDEIEYEMEPGKYYVISIYFKGMTYVETGNYKLAGEREINLSYCDGNHVFDELLPENTAKETPNYLFISGADVYTDDDSYAVIAFGDSITALQWPDILAKKIYENGITGVSVVRRAMGGNRILRDYGDYIARRRQGSAAIKRIEHDLIQSPGAKKLVLLEGINDLCHPNAKNSFCPLEYLPTPDELFEGYKKCFDVCRKYGLEIYQGTILPTVMLTSFEEDRASIRFAVNDRIRKCEYTDGYIEFSENMKDENDVNKLKEEYDRGDHLHPNRVGEAYMADLVYEKLF